jgi:hypothetical protein
MNKVDEVRILPQRAHRGLAAGGRDIVVPV